jgi:hypothetical protein
MANSYNNLPLTPASNATVKAFDNFYIKQFELDPGTFNMMRGFFESRKFDKSAAETIAVTIMKQAKQDGYNPVAVLDQLKGLQGVELNSLVSEILNFNRFKTSLIGHSSEFKPFGPVSRNILA